jgi:lysozyme family protein
VWRAPQNQVEAIYRQNYWNALRCDDLPAGVDYAVFDYGVNSGIGRTAKVLQRLVDVAVDGEVGPGTVAAAARANPATLIERICSERLAFLQGLRTWPTFGKGWGRRVREVRAAALKMAKSVGAKSAAAKPPTAPKADTSANGQETAARNARKIGVGAGVAAAIGAAAHWAGSHPILTAGAVVVAALVVLVVIRRFAKGD